MHWSAGSFRKRIGRPIHPALQARFDMQRVQSWSLDGELIREAFRAGQATHADRRSDFRRDRGKARGVEARQPLPAAAARQGGGVGRAPSRGARTSTTACSGRPREVPCSSSRPGACSTAILMARGSASQTCRISSSTASSRCVRSSSAPPPARAEAAGSSGGGAQRTPRRIATPCRAAVGDQRADAAAGRHGIVAGAAGRWDPIASCRRAS